MKEIRQGISEARKASERIKHFHKSFMGVDYEELGESLESDTITQVVNTNTITSVVNTNTITQEQYQLQDAKLDTIYSEITNLKNIQNTGFERLASQSVRSATTILQNIERIASQSFEILNKISVVILNTLDNTKSVLSKFPGINQYLGQIWTHIQKLTIRQ